MPSLSPSTGAVPISPQRGDHATSLPWHPAPTVPLSGMSTYFSGLPQPNPALGPQGAVGTVAGNPAAGTSLPCPALHGSAVLLQPPPSIPSCCFPQQLLWTRGSVSHLCSLFSSSPACRGPSAPDLLLYAAFLQHAWPLPLSLFLSSRLSVSQTSSCGCSCLLSWGSCPPQPQCLWRTRLCSGRGLGLGAWHSSGHRTAGLL